MVWHLIYFFKHCLKFYTNQRDESALKKDDMDLSMLLLPLCLDAMLVLLHEMSAFGAISKQHFKIFDTFVIFQESIKLDESIEQHPDSSQLVIQDTFQNSNSYSTSQSISSNIASTDISQPEDNSTQINQSDDTDPDATPTRQISNQSINEYGGQLNKVVAPIASIDSDTGTPDVTPKHTESQELSPNVVEDEDILNVTNELQIVEEGDLPSSPHTVGVHNLIALFPTLSFL